MHAIPTSTKAARIRAAGVGRLARPGARCDGHTLPCPRSYDSRENPEASSSRVCCVSLGDEGCRLHHRPLSVGAIWKVGYLEFVATFLPWRNTEKVWPTSGCARFT